MKRRGACVYDVDYAGARLCWRQRATADAQAEQPMSKNSQLLPGASFLHSTPLFSVVKQQRLGIRPY